MVFGFIALLGLTVYKAYFVKDVEQKQDITVIAEEGSNVDLGQKVEGDNKGFQTFGEIFTELNTDAKWRLGIRCGLRF